MDETKTVFKIYLHTSVSIIYLQCEFKNDTSSLLHNERVVLNKYETHWQREGTNIHLF